MKTRRSGTSAAAIRCLPGRSTAWRSNALSPLCRRVTVWSLSCMTLKAFEHNEIATMLECSTGNSKSQLHKARLKLRELLRLQSQALPVTLAGKEATA